MKSAALIGLASVIRSGHQLLMFVVGSCCSLLAPSWRPLRRSGKYPKWSGIPLALGFGLYIPQFFRTQLFRVAQGLLVATGCLWLAVGLWQQSVKGGR